MVFTMFPWFSHGFPMVFPRFSYGPNPHGHLRLHGASTRHPTPLPRSATSPGSMARSSGRDGLTVEPPLNSFRSVVGRYGRCLYDMIWRCLEQMMFHIYIYNYIYSCIHIKLYFWERYMISFHIFSIHIYLYKIWFLENRVDWKEHDLNFRDKKC